MKVKIICEEAYETSIWCKQIVSGIIAELRRKRQQYIKTNQLEDIEDNSVIDPFLANIAGERNKCKMEGVPLTPPSPPLLFGCNMEEKLL